MFRVYVTHLWWTEELIYEGDNLENAYSDRLAQMNFYFRVEEANVELKNLGFGDAVRGEAVHNNYDADPDYLTGYREGLISRFNALEDEINEFDYYHTDHPSAKYGRGQ